MATSSASLGKAGGKEGSVPPYLPRFGGAGLHVALRARPLSRIPYPYNYYQHWGYGGYYQHSSYYRDWVHNSLPWQRLTARHGITD